MGEGTAEVSVLGLGSVPSLLPTPAHLFHGPRSWSTMWCQKWGSAWFMVHLPGPYVPASGWGFEQQGPSALLICAVLMI